NINLQEDYIHMFNIFSLKNCNIKDVNFILNPILIKKLTFNMKILPTAIIYLTAIIEYICLEILTLSTKISKNNIITIDNIYNIIKNNNELNLLLSKINDKNIDDREILFI